MKETKKENLHQAMDNFLLDTESYKGADYHDSGLHASKIGSPCRREIILSYYGYKKKPETFEKRLQYFRGKKIHELVTKSLDESQDFEHLAHDFTLSDWLPDNVKGACDNIARDLKANKNILYEIKTAMPNALKSYSNSLPYPHNVIQIRTYAKALDIAATSEGIGFGIDELRLVYYDAAGTNHPISITVERDHAQVEMLIDSIFEDIERHGADKSWLPNKIGLAITTDKDNKVKAILHWACRYCDYRFYSCDSHNECFEKVKVVGDSVNGEIVVNKKYKQFESLIQDSYYGMSSMEGDCNGGE